MKGTSNWYLVHTYHLEEDTLNLPFTEKHFVSSLEIRDRVLMQRVRVNSVIGVSSIPQTHFTGPISSGNSVLEKMMV